MASYHGGMDILPFFRSLLPTIADLVNITAGQLLGWLLQWCNAIQVAPLLVGGCEQLQTGGKLISTYSAQ